LPPVRVVLAASKEEIPPECDKTVIARIDKPSRLSDITERLKEIHS